MKIIISPAKQMKVDTGTLESLSMPVFINRAEVLKEWVQGLSYAEQKKLWACNDKIAKENSERFRAMDGVVPYRLEMQSKVDVAGCRNLYDFWGDSLYREAMDDSHTIFNLASKEYSKCIESYLQAEDRFVTSIFGEIENGRVIQKGVYCKMARGEMVRYLAAIGAEGPEQARGFDWSGYRFDEEKSDERTYYFIRDTVPGK